MPSIFGDKAHFPGDAALAEALGKAKESWDAILDGVAELGREWKFYGGKHGWQLRVVEKKRVVLYLIPQKESFLAALALRDQALEALRASKLPAALVREIEAAKPGPEGRPARVVVAGKKDADLVRGLVALKLASLASR